MNKTETKIQSILHNFNKQWANSLCDITEKGDIKWNIVMYLRFLQAKSFHKIKPENSNISKYVHIQNGSVVDANPKYIKNYVFEFLIEYGSKKIKDSIVKDNIFFSQQLINSLRERIPYAVNEDSEEFLLKEGTLIVSKDEIHLYPQEY